MKDFHITACVLLNYHTSFHKIPVNTIDRKGKDYTQRSTFVLLMVKSHMMACAKQNFGTSDI